MGHSIHKHMHTHITKQNVKAAIKDDKAHMDYLKRDVKDDQRAGGKYKDINQTADEKHISKLAGDVRYDEKKEGMSRQASPLNGFNSYTSDTHKHPHAEGASRKSSPANNYKKGYYGVSMSVDPAEAVMAGAKNTREGAEGMSRKYCSEK